jgi:GNAT superfamily N-acetyltransferase
MADPKTSKTVETRLARTEDLTRIKELLSAYREELAAPVADPISLGNLGQEGPLYLLVAQRGEELVGVLAAHRCHDLRHSSPFLLLTDIYVRGPCRRQGVASALMKEVEDLARSLGCGEISLIVAHINNAALITAARAGFHKHDEILITRSLD